MNGRDSHIQESYVILTAFVYRHISRHSPCWVDTSSASGWEGGRGGVDWLLQFAISEHLLTFITHAAP